MYVTYTRIYGWSDYGGESSYQPGYRLENMMWMTLLVYDYIIPGDKSIDGFGIGNVNRRIRYYYGERYGVTLESVENDGTKATVTMAAQKNQPFS